jgi:hypothetical protein
VIIYCLSKLKKSQTTSQKHLGSAPATKSIAIASDSVFASLVELSGAMMNRINAPISTTTETCIYCYQCGINVGEMLDEASDNNKRDKVMDQF